MSIGDVQQLIYSTFSPLTHRLGTDIARSYSKKGGGCLVANSYVECYFTLARDANTTCYMRESEEIGCNFDSRGL
jgi:hypothetical protein